MLTTRRRAKYHRFSWLLGFLGFLGFRYFTTHEPGTLFFFSFFAMFSTYFTAKLALEMPDERYEANRLRAKAVTMIVPTLALLAVGLGTLAPGYSPAYAVAVSAFGWAAPFLTYAVAFYYFEKH